MYAAWDSGTLFFTAPVTKMERCFAISSGFFLPMARRNRSALPSE